MKRDINWGFIGAVLASSLFSTGLVLWAALRLGVL